MGAGAGPVGHLRGLSLHPAVRVADFQRLPRWTHHQAVKGHQGQGSRWPWRLLAPEAGWPLAVAMAMAIPSSWARQLCVSVPAPSGFPSVRGRQLSYPKPPSLTLRGGPAGGPGSGLPQGIGLVLCVHRSLTALPAQMLSSFEPHS